MNDATGEGGLPSHARLGVEYIAMSLYFEAHEQFEWAWRAASAAERDFYQGLVHVAVSEHLAFENRRYGALAQAVKARSRLAPFAPAWRGVDVARLLADLAEWERQLREDEVPASITEWPVIVVTETRG